VRGLGRFCGGRDWRLVRLQDRTFGAVERGPVVVQASAGVARIWVPAPVGVVEAVRLQVADKPPLPDALRIVANGATAELADQDWRGAAQLQVGPMGGPGRLEIRRKVGTLEPLLPPNARA